MRILTDRESFPEGNWYVIQERKTLVLYWQDVRVAEADVPGAGSQLSRYAFDRGATRVSHPYNLSVDEP